MKYLVTGGCGFVGCNIAAHLLGRGGSVAVFDNLSREGAAENLKWLNSLGKFDFFRGDIREQSDVVSLIEQVKPDVIFHLAGQVAMTTSMREPRRDFATNVGGSFNLLEAVREHASRATIVYSSSNK